MKERLKTLLLISLVGISLLFTKKSWIELPNNFNEIFNNDNKAYSATYLLSDMLSPNKYLLNFNDEYHTILNNDYKNGLWSHAKEIIAEGLSSKDIETIKLEDEEYHSYNNKRSIVFCFPEEVNTYILSKVLDIEKPNSIVDVIPNIDSIYLYLGEKSPFYIFSNNDIHYMVYKKDLDMAQLKEKVVEIEQEKNYNYYDSIESRYGIKNQIFIPYEMNTHIPRVFVENKIVSFTEEDKKQLVEKFFEKDIDYIREIVESNGSTIYVYNQKVLKLDINGTLEYFNSLENPVKKRNLYESMSTATEFMSKNTNVIMSMYLNKIEEIKVDNSLGYRFTFGYRVGGIPVILGNEEVDDFIQMEVFNSEVRSYKHHIRRYMNNAVNDIEIQKKIISSFNVIDMNYEYIMNAYLKENEVDIEQEDEIVQKIILSIENIDLAYFDPSLKTIGEELIPVWVIESEEEVYAFNIYNGELVYQQTRKYGW